MIINDLALQQRIGFGPHPAQREILDKMKRFTVISAGRRFGKSQLCAYLVLRELLSTAKKVWVVSPTYDLSKKVFYYIEQWIGYSLQGGEGRNKNFQIQHAPFPVIRSKLNSTFESKSAENKEGLMGEELDLVIVDEASAMSKEVWETYLFPSLANRQGAAFFISTPKGQNWFYHLYLKGKSKDEKNRDYMNFHYESKDNPYFPINEWDAAKETLPRDIFDQEYRAIFLADAAAVFRKVRTCATGSLRRPEKNHLYVIGVDLGKYQDFTVITVIDLADHHIVHLDRFKQIGWPLQKQRIISITQKYNNAIITVDSTGLGDPISDDLEAAGLTVNDFKYTNQSKTQLINKLSIFIEQKRIIYPPDEGLIDELESFGYTRTKAGRFQYGAPEGQYDDRVNSLALAVWELFDQPTGEGTGEIMTFPTTDF